MNKLLPIGCALSLLITAISFADPSIGALAWVVAAFFGLQLVGALLIAAGARRSGAYTALVGALPMIPIGIVSALGARKTLDTLAAERFERAGLAD